MRRRCDVAKGLFYGPENNKAERKDPMARAIAIEGKPEIASPQCYGYTSRFDEGNVASAATPRHGSLLYGYSATQAGLAKKAAILAVSVSAAITCGASFVSAVETVSIPGLPAPGLIDGDLSDVSWGKAFATGAFKPADPHEVLSESAEGWIFCDSENLYVGAKMRFTDYAAHEKWLSATEKRYAGDSVEVFIDPGDTGNYAQLGVTEAGHVMFSTGFCAPVSVGVQMHEGDWCMEAKIPFAAIKLKSDSFRPMWRINLARNNRQKKELSSWSALDGRGFHDIGSFNYVKGIKADLAAIRKEQSFASRGDFDVKLDRRVYTTQKEICGALDFVHGESMKGFRVMVTAKDASGKTVSEKSFSPVAFHVDFSFPIDGFPDGRYEVDAALLDASGNTVKNVSTAFWKVPPMPPNPVKWEIRDHCLYRDGKFMFPVVTTLCGWKGTCSNKTEYAAKADAVFAELADCGFNAVTTQPRDFPEEDEIAMDRCQAIKPWDRKVYRDCKAAGVTFADYCAIAARHGVGVITRCPYLQYCTSPYAMDRFVDHVRRIRTTPNLMGWHVSDEQDGRPEYNMMLNRLYHEIDPSRFTWINVINAVAQNIDTADIISTDPYPVPNSRLSMIASHGDRLVRATEGRPGQARWLYLQTHGNHGNLTRPPTPGELRTMTMLAVNHGATGLAYFMWTPPEKRNGKNQHQDAMATLKELTSVLRKWAPILCRGKVVFRGRKGLLDVLAVEHEGRKVLSVVNDSDGDITAADIDVAGFGRTTADVPRYDFKIVELTKEN